MTAVVDWIDERLRAEASSGAARLAPLAEVWEKAADAARETEALNLDKRPVILSIFADLAAARALSRLRPVEARPMSSEHGRAPDLLHHDRDSLRQWRAAYRPRL